MPPRAPKPGVGQGELFGVILNAVEVDGFAYARADFDPPATSLADYYRVLHEAVTALGMARSKGVGFPKLSEGSKPVKEYAYRMDTEPETAQHVVSKSAGKNRFKAQDILNKQHTIEYNHLTAFAKATGAFTLQEIFEQNALPPSIGELEHRYFTDPDKTPKELRAKRAQLARRAKKFGKLATSQVA